MGILRRIWAWLCWHYRARRRTKRAEILIHTQGVYTLPKRPGLAFGAGECVYWDGELSVYDHDNPGVLLGACWEAAGADDTSVTVILRGPDEGIGIDTDGNVTTFDTPCSWCDGTGVRRERG